MVFPALISAELMDTRMETVRMTQTKAKNWDRGKILEHIKSYSDNDASRQIKTAKTKSFFSNRVMNIYSHVIRFTTTLRRPTKPQGEYSLLTPSHSRSAQANK